MKKYLNDLPDNGTDAIVVAGGDGTLLEVVIVFLLSACVIKGILFYTVLFAYNTACFKFINMM